MKTSLINLTFVALFLNACTPRDIDQPVQQRSNNQRPGVQNNNTAGGNSGTSQFSQSSQPMPLASWLLQKESWILKSVFNKSPEKNTECFNVIKVKSTASELIERIDYIAGEKCGAQKNGNLTKEGRVFKTTRFDTTGAAESIRLESAELFWSYSKLGVKGAFVDLKERLFVEAYRQESGDLWNVTAEITTAGDHRDGEFSETFSWRQGFFMSVLTKELVAQKTLKSELSLTAEVKIKPFRRVRIILSKISDPNDVQTFSLDCLETNSKYQVVFNGGPNFKGELQRNETGLKDKKGEYLVPSCGERGEFYLEGQFLTNSKAK